jgi:glyoxylase-like metal-dependent hydrolase (beta-lactamase superfamily II)
LPADTPIHIRQTVLGAFQVNCYLLWSAATASAVCIDPGDAGSEVAAAIERLGLTLEAIVCTHAHLDHIMGVRELVAATAAPLMLHTDDQWLAARLPEAAERWFGARVPPCPAASRLLRDGDAIEVGGVSLRVVHTPGHTPGSICLHGHGRLFSGDTLFRASIGRTDLPGGDFDVLSRSLRRLFAELDDTIDVLPGHMEATTIGHERRTNPFVTEALAGGD